MYKKEFNKIHKQVSKMTDREKETFMALIDAQREAFMDLIYEDYNKEEMQVVESVLKLVGANTELVKEYGVYIEEYYQLPMKNRSNICKKYCDCFLKNGNNINSLFMLIAHEADHVEENVDPVVEAIRENNKLYDERPKINFKGMKYNI